MECRESCAVHLAVRTFLREEATKSARLQGGLTCRTYSQQWVSQHIQRRRAVRRTPNYEKTQSGAKTQNTCTSGDLRGSVWTAGSCGATRTQQSLQISEMCMKVSETTWNLSAPQGALKGFTDIFYLRPQRGAHSSREQAALSLLHSHTDVGDNQG